MLSKRFIIIDNIREYIPIFNRERSAIEINLTVEEMIVHFIALLLLPNACRAFIRGYSI